MDPLTASTLAGVLTSMLNSTATEAGKAAWTRLSTAVSTKFGHGSPEAVALVTTERAAAGPEPDAALPVASLQAAELLLALARRDQAIADLVADLSAPAIDNSSTVTNTINGTVHGPSVQAHTITGGITFGG